MLEKAERLVRQNNTPAYFSRALAIKKVLQQRYLVVLKSKVAHENFATRVF